MPNPHPNTSGLTPGGTSLTSDGVHSPRISFSVPAEWKRQLESIADSRNTGTAKLLREIVGDWLDTHHKAQND